MTHKILVRGMRMMLMVFALGTCATQAQAQDYPDVIDASVTEVSPGVYRFAATISSPYDTPERYADAFRIMSLDGKVEYGVRILWHDHASEQPFTRSLDGVSIPEGVDEIMIQGRDKANGYGGQTLSVSLP